MVFYVLFILFFITLQFNMDQANAEEFLEVYKGVVAEYTVSMGCLTFCTSYGYGYYILHFKLLFNHCNYTKPCHKRKPLLTCVVQMRLCLIIQRGKWA